MLASISRQQQLLELPAEAKNHSPVSGFSAAETTEDDEDVDSPNSNHLDKAQEAEEDDKSTTSSRNSSLTKSELAEYVDICERCLKKKAIITGDEQQIVECNSSTSEPATSSSSSSPSKLQRISFNQIRSVREEEAISFRQGYQRIDQRFRSYTGTDIESTFYLLCTIVALIYAAYLVSQKKIPLKEGLLDRVMISCKVFVKPTTSEPQVLSNIQLSQLQLLHDDLSQCIKRQSPTSFKYYMSENQQTKDQTTSISKQYRSLVCYGQESQWRKRFDRLKSEFDLDLAGLVLTTRRNVTNTILKTAHPGLQSELILDQLEYLQTLESKRTKKQTEDTIKHLKAENLYLLRRLNQPSENSYQKLVVSLELKSSRLQRENQALKANLMEKAGPVYIKQSMELEQYERENVMLKQFYHQVAQDVSRSLKQFNLHAMDATRSLDDHEILNSQLMLTRGYLRKLGEKISQVLLENESLKEELRETYLTNVLERGTSLQASLSSSHDGDNQSALGGTKSSNNGSESKALIADSCMRNLVDTRRRNKELEQEVSRLESKCRVDLEKINPEERHLNRSGTHNNNNNEFRPFRQLSDSSSSTTAMDKRYRESLFLANEEIVDELMTFITKFNHQVESKNFPIIESPEKDLLMVPSSHNIDQRTEHLLTTTTSNGMMQSQADDESETKIIPNYIREETRSRLDVKSAASGGDADLEQPRNDVGLPINFDAYSQLFNSTETVSSPLRSDLSEQESHNESHTQEAILKTAAAEPSSRPDAVVPVQREKNTTGEEQQQQEEEDRATGWVKEVVGRDGLFFKRAKQRRHLRGQQHNDRKDLYGRHANWAIKRAKLREKLREKLQKAWQFIESTFKSSSSSAASASASGKQQHNKKQHLNDHHHRHHQHHRPEMMDKARHSSNSKQRKDEKPRKWTIHNEL